MYDVTVLHVTHVPAAYARDKQNNSNRRPVPVVNRAIWLVESEVSDSGTAVAEDISKLHIGRSENKLFIARETTQNEPKSWVTFLGQAMEGMQGQVFVALIPTYASGQSAAKHWMHGTVQVRLFTLSKTEGVLEEIEGVVAVAPLPLSD